MTRLVALLAWYDEDPHHLAETIDSLTRIGVDHLIAVDGRYATFAPGSPASSPPEQMEAIEQACDAAGIESTVVVPPQPWPSEVAKRAELFRLGETVGADWYFVVDADEFVEHEYDVKAQLAATTQDAAVVTLREHARHGALRMFFRAIPGLTVQGTHHSYVTPDGRRLWGGYPMERALDMRELLVFHRNREREPERRELAQDYYRRRDRDGLERENCIYCGANSAAEIPTQWTRTDIGLSAKRWVAVCSVHERQIRLADAELLRSYGLDPRLARITYRQMEETFA